MKTFPRLRTIFGGISERTAGRFLFFSLINSAFGYEFREKIKKRPRVSSDLLAKKCTKSRMLLFAILASAPQETQDADKLLKEGYQLTLSLPVNWATSPKYSLNVTLPKGVNALQSIQEWGEKNGTLIEFVPEGQNGDNWKEIITLNKFIDYKIPADTFVDALTKRMISQVVEHGKVLAEEKESTPAYSHATSFISYDDHGKHEVLGMDYFSGPYDLVGVQYTIRTNESNLTDEEALQKIKQYFKDSLKVVSE